jgi:hypothetical protein
MVSASASPAISRLARYMASARKGGTAVNSLRRTIDVVKTCVCILTLTMLRAIRSGLWRQRLQRCYRFLDYGESQWGTVIRMERHAWRLAPSLEELLELDLSDSLHGYGEALLSCRGLLWRHVARHQLDRPCPDCTTGKAPRLPEDADQLGGAIALEGQ